MFTRNVMLGPFNNLCRYKVLGPMLCCDCGEKFTAICFASAFPEWMSSRRTEMRKMRKSESAEMQKQQH